ncbi:Molybdopterin adenylyltransferase [Dermatophilus congolensis]|uniref:Molybdopterin adenylyltransferase n=1 Tax=Dermatophilus congolensis TaxID=1863 RepID=A0A239VSQ2_9MICO|nr:MogA/MoaB family molybdenum cofactor biosynthesis protein [Dermatophilus congolensis]SNV25277.1 Molybdopterin adenylyltransferase [Dermatophilus congolensis]
MSAVEGLGAVGVPGQAGQAERPHGAGGVVVPDPFVGRAAARSSFADGASACVITCSDRASSGEYEDVSGRILCERLTAWGFEVAAVLVGDGEPVRDAVGAAVRAGVRVVLTSGGTGVASRDLTPEMTEAFIDRPLPGVAEAIRAVGIARGVPTSMLSRGCAGMAGESFVVNLPGSSGATRDALDVLADVLPHVLVQTGSV